LVEKGEIELVLGISQGPVGLGESVGSIFAVSVGLGSGCSGLVSIGLGGSELDVDGVIDALPVGEVGLGSIDSGEGSEESLVCFGLLGLNCSDVIDEGDLVVDGHLVEA